MVEQRARYSRLTGDRLPGRPWPGRFARPGANSPCLLGRAVLFLVLLAGLHLEEPTFSNAATAIVPDNYPTVQLGIDSGADTILVRGGTYAENVLLTPPVRRVVIADPAASTRPTLQGLTLRASDYHQEPMKVAGFRITTKVSLESGPPSARMEFERCLFEAGIGFIERCVNNATVGHFKA